MRKMFKYSDNNKRYHTLDYFYRKKFGCKVFKVSLDAGFTCPNIDGKVGTKGCIYCSNKGSGEFAGNKNEDLVIQFETIKNLLLKKWPNSKYIGYFQAHTNTYAPVNVLKEKYENKFKAYYTYEKGKNYTFLPIKIENVDLYKNQIKIW